MKILKMSAITAMLALWLGGAVAAEPSKKLFRWTDEHGVVHFGDQMPSAAVKQEHAVLKHDGQVTAVLAREPTAEEAAARERNEREQREQAAHDRSLLMTYSSEKDLAQARDDHLKTIDARIADSQKAVDEALGTLNAFHARQSKLAVDDKAGQDEMKNQLSSADKKLAEQSAALTRLQEDRKKADAQFAADIDRMHQLKQAGTQASPPPGASTPSS